MTHRVPEDIGDGDFDELTYSYYEVYGIGVSPREDGVLETWVDGEFEPVTDELLRGIHEVQGNDGRIFIDEHGQVRLTVGLDDEDLPDSDGDGMVFEGGNTASDEL